MNVKSKANSRCFYSKAFFVSLLFVVVLVSSCFISMFNGDVSPYVLGTSDRIVSNERELRNAINSALPTHFKKKHKQPHRGRTLPTM
jgi:hypothetical protein